ncbi:MAG: single-stranded DNA-binding protein [Clostridia bacterium]|nr:single-stranded DNA-binding protein [Clostridia bacterium]
MNRVFLIGNLTKDPEVASTSNGVKFCRFTLAVQRNYAKDGKKETDFLQVVVWRAQAENCAKYLKKGSKAAVSGSIQTRTYDGQDGKRYVTEIAADEVQFLSTKNGENDDDEDIEFDDLKSIPESDLPF